MRRLGLGSTLLWIGLSILTLLPVWWMLVVSMRPRVKLYSKSFVIDDFYWDNFRAVLGNSTFLHYLWNSMIVATSNAALVCTLGLLAAFGLSRYKIAGGDNVFFWLITNRMAPPAVFLLPLFLLFTKWFVFGDFMLFDTKIGLILLYCVFNLPFAIWLLKGMLDGIPPELDEAARVDGATTSQILFQLILPLARPGLAVTFILTWIFAWNEYLFAATLTSSSSARTVTTALAEYVSVTGTNWGEMAAMAFLTTLPALIVLGFVQKHIVTGLTFGALKG
ncbi:MULTISPECIES: carbohydrate ABC transporter permease [unclassified Mesorhizobium]|uniref:carbohydrate ABC transporter permease n=1 Tax=unclassified Mesorhizobium TaxID=325217 RepID=UPI0006F56397|nr:MULTISPECIES: carbohydrate ABC transporter permease [unclassified Mesorhizobium]KQZ14729.1 sugar ABC transporter [Mesorhizobium sp. Root1471]KQZ37236.1 sugar ABC transporter [Mesorhizobium sp. Root554]MDR7034262.1 multiple sugar transport system permease protein [Mesorhizobium sp. BE184]